MSLLCRYHQFRMNHALDDGFEPSAQTLKHLKTCSCCQSWYQGQRRLITHLKSLAKSNGPIESPQLLPGVLASLSTEPPHAANPSQKTTPLPWQKWLMPAATTCVAITLLIQWAKPRTMEEPSNVSAKWLTLSPDGLVRQTTGLSIADWGQQLDEPLEKEWLS
jgi:predicted anti-sigma-YlaC factor YlaD